MVCGYQDSNNPVTASQVETDAVCIVSADLKRCQFRDEQGFLDLYLNSRIFADILNLPLFLGSSTVCYLLVNLGNSRARPVVRVP